MSRIWLIIIRLGQPYLIIDWIKVLSNILTSAALEEMDLQFIGTIALNLDKISITENEELNEILQILISKINRHIEHRTLSEAIWEIE